jgi:hypothetical protein
MRLPGRRFLALAAAGGLGLKSRFADLGVVPVPLTPTEFGSLIATETEKWAKVVRTANIKPE